MHTVEHLLEFRGPADLVFRWAPDFEVKSGAFVSDRLTVHYYVKRWRPGEPPLHELPPWPGNPEPTPFSLNGLPAWSVVYQPQGSARVAAIEFRDLSGLGYDPQSKITVIVVSTGEDAHKAVPALVESIRVLPFSR